MLRRLVGSVLLAVSLIAVAPVPLHADGWFPKINSRGEIASGFGTIEVAGRVIGAGWGAHWLDDDTVVYGGMLQTVMLNVRSGATQAIGEGYNFMAAGGGTWVGTIAVGDIPTHRYVGTQRVLAVTQAGTPLASPGGRWGYVRPYHAHQKEIVVNGQVAASGLIVDAALTDRAVVYTVALSTYRRATMAVIDGAAPRDISIFNWEGPTACDGPDGPWVLSITQRGLAFRPAGARDGFYWLGEFYNPSCRFVNGAFRIASSSSRGDLQVMDIRRDGTANRVRYADITDDCVECALPAPAPAPAPTPAPNPPPVPQQLQAPNRMSVVADVIRAHPEINSCDEEARGAIVDYAAQRLNAAEGRLVWGRKSRGKPNGDVAVNPNTDGLTYLRTDGRFEIYDVISGSAPCGATWDGFGPFNPGDNGYWAPPQLSAEGGTTPPPPPPRDGKLEARIAALETDIRQLRAALIEEARLRSELDLRLTARVDELATGGNGVPEAKVKALIDAALQGLFVEGATSRALGHGHSVRLPVRR